MATKIASESSCFQPGDRVWDKWKCGWSKLQFWLARSTDFGPRSQTDGERPAMAGLGITILGSGSAGNACLLQTDEDAILIDAGFSAREMRLRMANAQIDETKIRGIVVSHEHGDHVKGVRVLSQKLDIPVFANRLTADAMRYKDAKLGTMVIFTAGHPFQVGVFAIEPFSIPHDAYDPCGFIVRAADCKIGIATDLGHLNALAAFQLGECDALIVESNHDVQMVADSNRSWSLKQRVLGRHGHLSNKACAELLQTVLHSKTRHVVLAHASRDCNRYALVEQSGREALTSLDRPDVELHVARQSEHLPTFWV